MYKPKGLRFIAFGDDALARLPRTTQTDYLRCYLHDLGARWVVEEPYYFDRDFLDEFTAFYGASARGYKNACRRLLFFGPLRTADARATEAVFDRALSGEGAALDRLQKAFLGFVVVRPLPASPLGRTVIRWYPERAGALDRVTDSRRWYDVHIAGINLEVEGLAWQQQDSAVGACATIGVWSMLHSSAFDEKLAIPTTAAITRGAHRTASLGDRVFPSRGLANHQLLEAIKEQGLAPIIMSGDIDDTETPIRLFRPERFASSCAALLRSGFPVVVSGNQGGSGHVICIVGFRPQPPAAVPTGQIELDDSRIEHLYIHDDTLGPNVRFVIEVGEYSEANLRPDAPPPRRKGRPVRDPTKDVLPFVPSELIVAVHDDVRVSPDRVHKEAMLVAQQLADAIQKIPEASGVPRPGLGISLRFMRVSDYLGKVLFDSLHDPTTLRRTRRELCEKVAPMSLHIAVVRIGVEGNHMLDILYDTTDSEPNLYAFAHVVYQRETAYLMRDISAKELRLGVRVDGFERDADA